jgi:hypothetical protein
MCPGQYLLTGSTSPASRRPRSSIGQRRGTRWLMAQPVDDEIHNTYGSLGGSGLIDE